MDRDSMWIQHGPVEAMVTRFVRDGCASDSGGQDLVVRGLESKRESASSLPWMSRGTMGVGRRRKGTTAAVELQWSGTLVQDEAKWRQD
jgi:hypothetical protein